MSTEFSISQHREAKPKLYQGGYIGVQRPVYRHAYLKTNAVTAPLLHTEKLNVKQKAQIFSRKYLGYGFGRVCLLLASDKA